MQVVSSTRLKGTRIHRLLPTEEPVAKSSENAFWFVLMRYSLADSLPETSAFLTFWDRKTIDVNYARQSSSADRSRSVLGPQGGNFMFKFRLYSLLFLSLFFISSKFLSAQ